VVLTLVQTLDEAGLVLVTMVIEVIDSLDSVWYLCSISGFIEGQLPDSETSSR